MNHHVLALAVSASFCLGNCAKPNLAVRDTVPPLRKGTGSHKTHRFVVGATELSSQSWHPTAQPLEAPTSLEAAASEIAATPQQTVKAVLVIQHGLRDHGDNYARVAKRLGQQGIAVYAMDLPGHG